MALDTYDDEPQQHPLVVFLDEPNLVDRLQERIKDTTEFGDPCQEIMNAYSKAEQSMDKWQRRYKKALWLAKQQPYANDAEIESKDFPFDGASLAMLPYVMEAMLDFNSRAAPELVWSNDIIKVKVYGDDEDGAKEERAERVSEYSNKQLEEIPDWRDEQDKALLVLPCVGTIYKETYFDADIQEVCSEFYMPDEIIFDHSYRTFKAAPDRFREATYSRNEVMQYIRGAQKWEIGEKDLKKDEMTFDFLIAYTWLDLDDDDIREPYICVIWKDRKKIVSIVPWYDEDSFTLDEDGELVKIKAIERFTQYRFIPGLDEPMGMGWGILLGPMFESINTNLRQLIDAGTVQNTSSNSGFINIDTTDGRGNANESGPIEVRLGKLVPIQSRAGKLSDHIFQFPASGPSQALFNLLQFLIDSCRSMTNAALSVEANANEAATLYLARLQQGLKIPNAIIMRVYSAAESEFQKIFALNGKHYSDRKYKQVLDDPGEYNMRADFNSEDCDIRLVADPSQGSDLERAARAEAIKEEAKQAPSIFNLREAMTRWAESIGTPNIDALLPEPGPDPMQELMQMQMKMEAEFRHREIGVKEREAAMKELKTQMEAAELQVKLGFMTDQAYAEVAKTFAEAAKALAEAGQAEVLSKLQGEDRYIKETT